MQIQATLFDKLPTKSDEDRMQNILESEFTKEITLIVDSPEKLVFDNRANICCKFKCPNYGTRCFCPPESLNLTESAINKKYVIILAKTYDYSELRHFINNPRKKNKKYLYKKRVFVRRWVQHHFYRGIKEIFENWGLNQEDIFAGGFSLIKCRKCYSMSNNETPFQKCIPLPSPEALGIDVAQSMLKYEYYIKFGEMDRMTKVSMIFTDNNACEPYLGKTIHNADKPHSFPNIISADLIEKLKATFQNVEFQELEVERIKDVIRPEYYELLLWSNAIVWQTIIKNKVSTKTQIHQAVFNENNHFALDFNIDDVLLPESGLDNFYGIEFY